MRLTAFLLFLAGCSSAPAHRYTCAEMLGVPPKPGTESVLETVPDFSMWDEQNRLVCDERGRDVRAASEAKPEPL